MGSWVLVIKFFFFENVVFYWAKVIKNNKKISIKSRLFWNTIIGNNIMQ